MFHAIGTGAPLVTTVTPSPTLDPGGTGVYGPTAVSTYSAMEFYFTKIDWFHKCIFSQEMAIFGKIKKKFLI